MSSGKFRATLCVVDEDGPVLNRATTYSYRCNACRRCCYDKRIQLNPYEIVRLATNQGISSTAFLGAYTEDGGAVLKVKEDGACVFLDEHGCSVHPDRPLVCRLYPLGRIVDGAGHEKFVHVEPHPQTAGSYGDDGTIADYLCEQDAAPFMEAADRYYALLQELAVWLNGAVAHDGRAARTLATEISRPKPSEPDQAADWFDIDPVVEAYIAETGAAAPETVLEKMEVHIAAVRHMVVTSAIGVTHE